MMVLRAVLPALAFFSLAFALENGWIGVRGVRYESIGSGSTMEYSTGTQFRVDHRYPQYRWLMTDVYLDSGSATFGIAGRSTQRIYRAEDHVAIYTPSARIEGVKVNGARFTVSVEPTRTTIVCAHCGDDVTVQSRSGTPFPLTDGGTTVVPFTAQATGVR
ncbi:MAG TPA: hypothetical protein VGD01_17995 [Candidatus Elarobacter sp.]|jgi:hypothetical protein